MVMSRISYVIGFLNFRMVRRMYRAHKRIRKHFRQWTEIDRTIPLSYTLLFILFAEENVLLHFFSIPCLNIYCMGKPYYCSVGKCFIICGLAHDF